jgi:hypothetical protein
VLSPASVTSEVCRTEIVYAAEQGKRLIPIVAREVEPGATPEELAKLNWIFFRDQDDFDDAFAKLIDGSTLETRAELELPDSTRAPKFLFDPESRFVVATGTAGASVLDLRSLQWHELIAGGAGRAGWRPAFTADGHWLVLGAGETTRLFRTSDWGALPPVSGSVRAFDQQGTRLCTQIAAVRGRHPGYHVVWELASGQRLGSVGLGAYLGRTAAEYGEGDIALAEQCEGWEPSKLVDAHPEPVRETPRWRVERDGDSVLLFGLQPDDRIAEACRRIPRPLTPDEWTSFMGDEDYRPTYPEPPLVDSPDV